MKQVPVIVLGGIAYGVLLGTMFSIVYPTVEIAAPLALLFALIGIILTLITRALYKRRVTTEDES